MNDGAVCRTALAIPGLLNTDLSPAQDLLIKIASARKYAYIQHLSYATLGSTVAQHCSSVSVQGLIFSGFWGRMSWNQNWLLFILRFPSNKKKMWQRRIALIVIKFFLLLFFLSQNIKSNYTFTKHWLLFSKVQVLKQKKIKFIIFWEDGIITANPPKGCKICVYS